MDYRLPDTLRGFSQDISLILGACVAIFLASSGLIHRASCARAVDTVTRAKNSVRIIVRLLSSRLTSVPDALLGYAVLFHFRVQPPHEFLPQFVLPFHNRLHLFADLRALLT